MVKAYTWDSLRRATARRQFPAIRGRGAAAVAELFARVGPIQAQAPRAPFLAVASRLPGAQHRSVTQVYESGQIVRATSLRGTVHTSVRAQQPTLDAVTRLALTKVWCRTLKVSPGQLAEVWREIENVTHAGWLPHAALNAHMVAWLGARGWAGEMIAGQDAGGLALFRGHSAMIRRPLTGSWDQAGTWGYRAAAAVWGPDPVDPGTAVVTLVRAHLLAFGPATRRDLAWWSGAGLRRVDAALESLRDELTARPGPEAQTFYDVVDPPSSGGGDPGVRLLPEYDSVLLGYAPAGRRRFSDQVGIGHAWNPANGVFQPTVLSEAKIRATWLLARSGDTAILRVAMFPGERVLTESSLADQAQAVSAVLGVAIAGLEVV